MLYNIIAVTYQHNRLESTPKGRKSPLLVLRFGVAYHKLLKRVAKARGVKASALARELLEKALEREEKAL